MNKVILDTSALLAFLQAERGAQIVEGYLPHSLLCTVNLTEVIERLLRCGFASD